MIIHEAVERKFTHYENQISDIFIYVIFHTTSLVCVCISTYINVEKIYFDSLLSVELSGSINVGQL